MRPIQELERLSPVDRRSFLKVMGAALSAPAVGQALRYACHELALGEAYAQEVEATRPTWFIEWNLRDQWDQGHVFVAPGLATAANLRRGTTGRQAALFYTQDELRSFANGVYLTGDSIALEPHLDSIAMIDCCELSRGAIHGHEAANALRSPGRDYTQRAGAMAMFQNDPVSNFPQGCEEFYSSTPTPATLHNWVQKQNDPGVRNGFTFKGVSRSIHTVYHFGAGLPGAELDRIQSRDELYRTFPDTIEDFNVLATEAQADVLARILERVDGRFLSRRRYGRSAIDGHAAVVAEAKNLLYVGQPRVISLPLTPEETAYWSDGVPDQACDPSSVKAQIWEQVAFAHKIVANDLRRSVALEFDYVDVHDQRTEDQMRIEAKQVVLPLARLIQGLKDAGIWDRTLVAIYCADGSRSPAAGSQGTEGKDTVIFAGGMIRGGYYGDIRVDGDEGDGHRYSFHAPDDAGAPGPGVTDNSRRVSGAAVWRTVMRALEVSDEVCDRFPDVRGVGPLSYVLR